MKPGTVELGTVIAPSGRALILDAGDLDLWCHDRAIVMPKGKLSTAEVSADASEAVDCRIEGPEAEAAGRALGRQWHPTYLFDVPRKDVSATRADLDQLGLLASLRVLDERVSHRRRIDLALEHGRGAGELQFHGLWAGAVGDLPAGELRVFGERMPDDSPDRGRLASITLVVREGRVEKSEPFAKVMVDFARLLIVDADAVGLWQHDAAIDGKGDFAFWGRDAEVVAKQVSATLLDGEGVFGWRDLPIGDAVRLGSEVEDLRASGAFKFATDFRPHSHHYQLMEQVRAGESESGVVTLGAAKACGFMTTWGDGLFDVVRDLGSKGELLKLRIELGTPQRQKLMRSLDFRWFKAALVSRHVTEGGRPVRFMYRETPDRDSDSGWRMFSGEEPEAYSDDAANIEVVPLHRFDDLDPRVARLLEEPIGAVYERVTGAEEFKPVMDWKPSDD